MRRFRGLIRAAGCSAALALAAAGVAAEGNGLVLRQRLSPELQAHDAGVTTVYSPLRSRLAFGVAAPAAGHAFGDAPSASPAIVGARLLGDYYFGRPRPGDDRARGFRATSGLLVGSRLGTWGAGAVGAAGPASVSVERRDFGLLPPTPDAAGRLDSGVTVPYVGVGYSDAFGKGRWGLSADLGLMALRPAGGARLGRASEGGNGFDDTLRDLRLAPLLQLGVSYSF